MTPLQALISAVIGLVAGLLGGLCGIGGSVVMLPALAFVFGSGDETGTRHHLYMSAAMLVNAVVAGASVRQHARARAIDGVLVRQLLPTMCVCMIGGVALSNELPGWWPRAALGVFLLVYAVWTIVVSVRALPDHSGEDRRRSTVLVGSIGGATGLLSGVLAIGGGVVLVPALQLVVRVPVRRAIASTATVMCASSAIGATQKLATLDAHGLRWQEALVLGGVMGVGALVGAPMGARLTHRVPMGGLRVALALVLGASGVRLAGML